MSNFAPKRTSYTTGDRRWARNFLALDTHDVSLDGSLFTAGVVPSGTAVGLVTATGLAGPYTAAAADGTETCVGLLINDVRVAADEKHLVAVASGGGPVDRRYLPAGHDAAAEADLSAINFIH